MLSWRKWGLIMENEAKIVKIIAMMFGAFGQGNDINRIKIYTQFLKSFPFEVVDKAVQKVILNCKFLPTIAELTSAIKELSGAVNEDLRVRSWEEAWNEIQRKMQSTPWGKTPEWSSPEIKAAVDAFGWYDLQTCLADDMPTIRAQMRRFYEDACNRLSNESQNKALFGSGGNILGIAERATEQRSGVNLLNKTPQVATGVGR